MSNDDTHQKIRAEDGNTKVSETIIWGYYDEEYPDEGGVFPFATEAEARAHAGQVYDDDPSSRFGVWNRPMTDDEEIFYNFGRASLAEEMG